MASESTPAAAVPIFAPLSNDDDYETALDTEELEGNAKDGGGCLNFDLDEKYKVVGVADEVKVEEERSVVGEDEKDGGALISVPDRGFEEEDKVVEKEEPKFEMENGEAKAVSDSEAIFSDGGVENGEAKDASHSEAIFNDNDVVFDPVEDIVPPPALSEDIESREAEIEASDNSGVTESSVSTEKVERPDADAGSDLSLKENGEAKSVSDSGALLSDDGVVSNPIEDADLPSTLSKEAESRETEIDLQESSGAIESSVPYEKVERPDSDASSDDSLKIENRNAMVASDSEALISDGGSVLNPIEDVHSIPTLSEGITSTKTEIEPPEKLGSTELSISNEKVEEPDAYVVTDQNFKMENVEAKAVFDPETKLGDAVVVLGPVEDADPPPDAEEVKSTETENDLSENLGSLESSVSFEKVESDTDGSYSVTSDENDTLNEAEEGRKEEQGKIATLDSFVGSSFPVLIRKEEPTDDGTHVTDDDENPAKNEEEDKEGYGEIEVLETCVESPLPVFVADENVEPDTNEISTENEANEEEEEDNENTEPEIDDDNLTENEDEEEEDEEDVISAQQPRVAILDSSETAKQIIKEMEEGLSSTSYGSSGNFRQQMDGQIISDSDEVETDEENDGKEIFDSAALAALLKAATGASSDGNISLTSQDGTRVFSVDRPAGLGLSAPSLRPAFARSTRPSLYSSSELAVSDDPDDEMNDEERKLHEKVEDIRVKFLRLVMRLGHTPEDTVVAQILYRLNLTEWMRRGRQIGRGFSIESSKKKAIQLESDSEKAIDFSCNILVLGKTGVGKSATINSIFGEEKSKTNAFIQSTSAVREISAVVDGVKIRILDTPGLKSSVMDQATNIKILSSIKKYMKKCPPDIVLYVDRLDTQTRDFNDLPLLKSITSALGSSIWLNAIVALTHASSAPPEGPNGAPLSYEVFIAQRSHVIQHSVRQAVGDMRLMNAVALVENHPNCRRNREGERVLPNGLSWRLQMLLLCYSSKISSEADSLLKSQEPNPARLFGLRFRTPPLPYLLSTLLQTRSHPKLSSDQGGDNGDSDIDVDDFSDAEEEEEDEYDQLPPFKPLKKSQIAKLTKEQKRAYFDEYDYRVKLFQKKQLKGDIRRLKEMKKRGKVGRDNNSDFIEIGDDFDQDGAPAPVAVPLPDRVLPPSFDCDLPTYRYRFLEPNSQLLTGPLLDTHGWDHDCGYDGVSLEQSLAIASKFPATTAVQITKDKEFNIHLDSSVSAKHGETGSTLAGFDIQSLGKQMAYILRGETKFKNFKKNKTTGGISVTFLGENVATGLKVEDHLSIGKRVSLVASTGAIRSQGDVAYGANLEARLREKDYPIGQAVSTLGLSLMKWRGDLALGANLQSQVNIGRSSKVAVRVGLNNKLSGQITVRTSSSEQLELALVGIIPVALSVFRNIWPGESEFEH